MYQIPGKYGCSKSQETGSSPSSVPIHVTLGSHSVFSSVKWVHAKIISKFPSVLTFNDANCGITQLETTVPLGEKEGNADLHIMYDYLGHENTYRINEGLDNFWII